MRIQATMSSLAAWPFVLEMWGIGISHGEAILRLHTRSLTMEALEKWCLEDYFPIIGKATFQGLC